MADNEISGTENANGVPQLKPCPFCGGEAKFHIYGRSCNVTCLRCQIGTRLEHIDEYEVAVGAWNTRAERTCHVVPHGYCIANGEKSSCRCWSCSECSYGWHVSDYDRQYRYCPNCGAEVVEE